MIWLTKSFNRLLAGLLGLVVFSGALLALGEAIATQPLMRTARGIEEGNLAAVHLDRRRSRISWELTELTCIPGRRRAAVTFRLWALDMRLQQAAAGKLERVDLVDEAFEQALASIKDLVKCIPTDGNGWLRLAMVLNAAEGPDEPVIASLERSLWTAPHESWIVKVRAPFAARLMNAGVADPGVASVIGSDARTMVQAGAFGELRDFARGSGEAARKALERALEFVGPERRAIIDRVLNPASG